MRPVVKKENPDLQGVAIIKKIVEKYKFIEPALLEQYQAQYRKDQEEYIKKRYLYETKLSPDQKQDLADAKEAKAERRERLAYKKVRNLLKTYI